MKAIAVFLVIGAALTAACLPGSKSAMGFRLPDGDADRGLQAFTELKCYGCHTVEGVDLQPANDSAEAVKLGGSVTRVRTYGELVTSIINPSHKLAPGYTPKAGVPEGESPMALARLNEAMTVQQLIDLVAFLQAKYEIVPPQYNPYGYVYR